ncbi:MAG: hypothetical protein ABIH67_02880 [Candidatus Uhrbacteria bacterium]
MRKYKIEQLTLPYKCGQIEAEFQVVLRNQVYVLTENWYRVVRGAVLIWNARLKLYQVYQGGLFDAIRGTKHAKKGYGLLDGQLDESGEIHQLTLSRSTIAMLLRQIWDYGNLSNHQRNEYAQGCLALFEDLESVQDEGKVIARDRIKRAQSVIDKLGRRNPSSRAPMLWSSADKLEQRQINIRDIARWVDIRQFVLLTMLDEMYEIVHQTYELTGGEPDTIQIRSMKSLLENGVIVLPFRRGFARTAVDLKEASRRLTLPNPSARTNVARYLDRAQRAMVLYMIRRDLEPIIWRLTSELAKRKANRQVNVLDAVLQDLVDFCEFLFSIQGFDKMFRHPVLPRMHHHLSAVVQAGRSNDWPAASQELEAATIMF